jgi:hypothetical protein|tara:strand:- start:17 stop:181 length:165 start_codon:yes stop_codon:yes gene_type:complete
MQLIKNTNKLISLLNCNTYIDSGSIIKETTDDRDEYFFIKAINDHKKIKINPKI